MDAQDKDTDNAVDWPSVQLIQYIINLLFNLVNNEADKYHFRGYKSPGRDIDNLLHLKIEPAQVFSISEIKHC